MIGSVIPRRRHGLSAFGHDTWGGWCWPRSCWCSSSWVVMTLFAIWFERRVVARMQLRPGPNRVRPARG